MADPASMQTTRVLKSRLELALFKVGRGWEGVRFERIEAAHSQQQNSASDTTSSSVDLGDDALDASHASSSSSTTFQKQAAAGAAGASSTSNANGSTANWLERSAGHQEQLHSSLNGQDDALLSPIKPLNGAASATTAATPTTSTRQARSASTSSTLQKQTQAQPESPSVQSTRNTLSSGSPMPTVAAPSRPATTRPSLTASTSSLDCNPRPASARPRSDSNVTISASGPLSAPPTTTTFSSPIANTANNPNSHQQDEFATPATSSRGNKRQRRESHQPKSSSKRQHATIQEEEGSPPPNAPHSASSSASSSAVLNAAHLGHKRKISQNTLWHQSRAILSGIGGASANALSPGSQPANASNAFQASHPSPQAYLNGQNAAALTSPVRLKPGQQRPYGTPQDSFHQQGQLHSSPYGNMQQQSPQGYALQTQGSSVSPAGSSSGGTVRGASAAVQTTPRRPSAQMMQTAPHTIASSHHSHHQYMPHHPSNLGLASSSGSSNGGNPQMQFNPNAALSTGMMQQVSQQGQLLQPQQQQQALYAFQSPQAGQQPDYGYVVYNQQPHIMQTPQHAQSSSHMMQHPHTAPQLHHSQQSMLAVNGYGMESAGSGANGMNVFGFGDAHQSHLSPSYPQQQQQMQQQTVYGTQVSPLNMSNGFRGQNNAAQSQVGASTQMGHTMSMQGLPSQQPPQQPTHLTMMRSQSAISHAPSDMSTFNGSQPPPLDPSLLNASSSNGGSQESSSVDTNYSTHQNAQAAQIVAAHVASGQHRQQHHQQGSNTRPGTANGNGPERETAAELMLYLAASPSPQQPSKKVGNTALGGGDLSQVKGRKLFGNEDASSQQQRNAHVPQQQQHNQQQQMQQPQQQQAHRNSVSNHSQTSAGSGMNGSEMSRSQSQMELLQHPHHQQQDQSNPFAVQHTYPGMHEQSTFAPNQQQLYTSTGQPADMHTATAAAHQLAQPFEYNPAAMQFDPYAMMTAQGVTLDQEFGSGW